MGLFYQQAPRNDLSGLRWIYAHPDLSVEINNTISGLGLNMKGKGVSMLSRIVDKVAEYPHITTKNNGFYLSGEEDLSM